LLLTFVELKPNEMEKLTPLTLQELSSMCKKNLPSDDQMKEIKQKVDAVLKEFQEYHETLEYWQDLYNKKKQMSN
jgi:hypothetical protein